MNTTRMEEDEYGTFLGKQPTSSEPHVVRPLDSSRKWLMLAILSALTAVNQGICYSYAPIASYAETRWDQHMHSTELITVYFISYIPCSFIGSWLMDKQGLRFGILLGGFLQALGATVRYLATFAGSVVLEAQITLLGQILASIAMPFMVNSPPVLSANWFPPSQRATSTSIAVNANAMGTAFVYLSAPFVVHSTESIPEWNLTVAVVAIASFAVACIFFRSFPASLASSGETESLVSEVQLNEEYDWKQWGNAFTHRGFSHTVFAFSVAECVVNAISALLGKFLSTENFSKSEIGIIGALFIVSSLVGSQIISGYVDKKRNHKNATIVCVLLTAAFLALFKATLSLGNTLLTLSSLMAVGAFLGPLQPIVLELGVECAFPTSEATVAALQQLCGNFLSAILVPGLSVLRRTHTDDSGHVPPELFWASPEWVMVFLLGLTFLVFCVYNGEYKRFDHEVRKSPTFRPRQSSLGFLAVSPEIAADSSEPPPSLLPVTVKAPIKEPPPPTFKQAQPTTNGTKKKGRNGKK